LCLAPPWPVAARSPQPPGQGQAFALTQVGLIIGPVGHLVALPWDMVTAILVQLKGTRGIRMRKRTLLCRIGSQHHRRIRAPQRWLAEVNVLLVDLRDMPREVQAVAYQKDLIPYIPADQE
jgi:hypothetical protein